MIQLGPLTLRLYGLILGIAAGVGFWVADKMRVRLAVFQSTLNNLDIWGGMWWVVLSSLIGARIYHVIGVWEYYSSNPFQIIAVWNGGLGIFGAIFGGLAGAWLYSRRYGIPLLDIADLGAFGLPIGQAIGRWGNFINHELYGKPTHFPWGIAIPQNYRLPQVVMFERFHPLFLYESLYNLFVFGVLYFVLHKVGIRMKSGMYFAIYITLYGFGRFWLEFLRVDSWSLIGLNIAQVVSLLLITMGLRFVFDAHIATKHGGTR